jgi:DNA-binding response OmpR family regulator
MDEPQPATKVLIVDDNEDCITVLRRMLVAQGYDVRAAENGAKALEKLEEAVPDVMLLDLMMPEIDGLQLLQKIRDVNATARMPVIILSAKTNDDDVMLGYQYGADYYITKPFTTQQVCRGIDHVLNRASESERSTA